MNASNKAPDRDRHATLWTDSASLPLRLLVVTINIEAVSTSFYIDFTSGRCNKSAIEYNTK